MSRPMGSNAVRAGRGKVGPNEKYDAKARPEEPRAADSMICSGSDFNRRSFATDESWNSLQSTILACHLDNVDDVQPEENFDESYVTVGQEELENPLNVNLDALSDDVFYDCLSPRPGDSFPSPIGSVSKSPELVLMQPSNDLLTVEHALSDCRSSDSGIGAEKTGAMVAEMIEEMRSLAHSTPDSFSSDSFSPSSLMTVARKAKSSAGHTPHHPHLSQRRLTFKTSVGSPSPSYRPFSPVDVSVTNKENFFKGKYANAVSVKGKSPAAPKCGNRVAAIKCFYETMAEQSCRPEQMSQIRRRVSSRNNAPAVSPNGSRLSASWRSSKIPIFRPKAGSRMMIKTHCSSNTTANNISVNSLGRSSCTDTRTTSYSDSLESSRGASSSCSNRSKSVGDVTSNEQINAELLYAMRAGAVSTRYTRPRRQAPQRTTLHKDSPKRDPKSPQYSAIMKRKSLGLVKSPVKPVKEIRKKFSPSFAASNKARMAMNKVKTNIPKIVVSEYNK